MTRIKICGITNKADAVMASSLGVDMLGFVFYKESKRYVAPAAAADIINELPPYIGKAGVFAYERPDDVLEIARAAGLDILQFHGDETPEYCGAFRDKYRVIKAFRIQDKEGLNCVNDYDVDFYLFDTYKGGPIGGTGETFDWNVLKDFEILKPVILSGGLKPQNVGGAIKKVSPYGVDVSTGVERSPGKKDGELMKRFVENVRKTD